MISKEIIKDVDGKMKKSIESARREFTEVRTGRAHTGLIEGLHVDCYDSKMMMKEVASISIPDPKTIVIQPWDPTVIQSIEKAILDSHLGVMPTNDGKLVRLSIPPLSEERREDLKKVVREMAEKSRISLRTIRRDANDKIKKLKADKTISEDEEFKAHEEIQKMTDRYIKEIDQLVDAKTAELSHH